MEAKRRHLLPNPAIRASFLSKISFWWAFSVISKGLGKILNVSDLWQPIQPNRSRILGKQLEVKWEEMNQPRLAKALLKTFLRDYGISGALMIFSGVFIRISFPYLLKKVCLYFIDQELKDYKDATLWTIGLFLMVTVAIVSNNHIAHYCFHTGLKMQTALGSLIYKKILRVPSMSLDKDAVEILKNTFSRDPGRLDVMSLYFHYLWASPLLLAIIGTIMYMDIGMAALPGLIVIVTMIPLQNLRNKFYGKFSSRITEITKERYLKTKEVIENIEIVKKHAWVKNFNEIISKIRNVEMKFLQYKIFQHAIHVILMIFTSRIALLATLVTMVYTGQNINILNLFAFFYYFDILTITVTQIFTRAINQFGRTTSYLQEVEKFLHIDEITPKLQEKHKKKRKEGHTDIDDKFTVHLKNVSSTWDQSNSKIKFKKLNAKFRRETLVCVVGPPKCGKTSFLHTILQDMLITGGHVIANGPIGYAPQIPWTFSSTVRQNILFGSTMFIDKYDAVVRSCALVQDLNLFPNGDLTLIREDENLLSENQKLKINLARAIYRDADIYLFDDNLRHLPPLMAQYIFDKVLGSSGRLNKSLRILVTNEQRYINEADWVVVMDQTGIANQGKPSEVNFEGLSYISPIDENVTRKRGKELSDMYGVKEKKPPGIKPVDKYNNSLDTEYDEDIDENSSFDHLPSSKESNTFLQYISEGAGIFYILFLGIAFLLLYSIIAYSDAWLTFWTTMEIARSDKAKLCANTANCSEDLIEISKRNIKHFSIFYNMSNYAQEIVMENFKHLNLPETTPYALVYTGLIALAIILGIIVNIAFSRVCLKANKNLHNKLLNKITSGTMAFFHRTSNQKIFRIFDVNINTLDKSIPMSLLESLNLFLWITAWGLSSIYTSSSFTIILVIILMVFFKLQQRLLRITKRLKELENGMKIKLLRHMNTTIKAIPMIRAFGVEDHVRDDFDHLQDIHSSTISMSITTTSAYSLLLEFLCLISVGVVMSLTLNGMLVIEGQLLPFALTQFIGFAGMLGWSLKQTVSSSGELTSTDRIFKYCTIEQEEDPSSPEKVRKAWPEYGRIVYHELFLRYTEVGNNAISNVSFTFRPREKIGIVGNTGSGKTSLVNALYRIGFLKGYVEIDRTNISTVTLEDIRSSITTITKKPAIFSGTIKSNLDPLNEHRYNDIIFALNAVELDMLDLNMVVYHNGENLTLKQRQLLAFARAILRKNKIIVLDEAMSNMDEKTIKIVQNVITEYLDESTIFIITDQLEHIIYADTIFVIENGAVKESGLPHDLLQKPEGKFYKMVHSYKKVNPIKLVKIAESKIENNLYLKIPKISIEDPQK